MNVLHSYFGDIIEERFRYFPELGERLPMTVAAAVQSKTKPHAPKQTLGSVLRFFLPLGFAACLVSITHAIIHSTLSHAAQPEIAIASYSIGMSLFMLTERPAVLLRQTCSALVRDKVSFRAMSGVTWLLIAAILAFGALICYTPAGELIFRHLYGADPLMIPSIVTGYQFLMWVSIFSALRCLYHGVIINQMRTKWVTIGMIVRLFGMFALSQYFIRTGSVSGAWVGALIFAAGMLIEAGVCYTEGRSLVRKLPDKEDGHEVVSKQHIFTFYRPLLLSSFLVVLVQPAINAMLGKTVNMELSIASFAVATSVFNIVASMFSYIHQIVLNFYRSAPQLVFRFQKLVCLAPSLIIAAISFSPAGSWILSSAMGLSGSLLTETLQVLQVFVIVAAIHPWLDFGNGFLMLFRRTDVFMWSQSANTITAVTLLVLLVWLVPHWDGMIGALTLSAGYAAELSVVAYSLYRARWEIQFRKP